MFEDEFMVNGVGLSDGGFILSLRFMSDEKSISMIRCPAASRFGERLLGELVNPCISMPADELFGLGCCTKAPLSMLGRKRASRGLAHPVGAPSCV